MPLLFALGQHPALASVQEGLAPGDVLLAYLDDVYVKTLPARVGVVYASVDGELFRHAGIRVHGGKTRVWNSAGTRPLACDILEQIAQATSDHAEPVWRGSDLPTDQQGIKVLGTPLGHADFVRAHLDRKVGRAPGVVAQDPNSSRPPISMAPLVALCSRQSHLPVARASTRFCCSVGCRPR